jgi:CRP/FNR family cyclic AMP-dependent transcriptional regulator
VPSPAGANVSPAMRITQDTKTRALKRAPLFAGLSGKQLARIARVSDDLEVPAGTMLCKEGSRGQEFFVIIDGEATVSRAGKLLATIGPGDFFGEIALLESVRRTATVRAATALSFFVIRAEAFDFVISADPTIERRLLQALARRLLSHTADPA